MAVAEIADDTLFATLKSTFGYDSFRPLQHEIVRTVVDGGDVFVLMPTGGGKSLCFQLPALLREGVTIVVSPLIALMKDQVDALNGLGVRATFINSSLELPEIEYRLAGIAEGRYALVYAAPERLMLPGFLKMLSTVKIAGFAIDEAHCISEWGHDFRPEYRGLKRLRELFPGVPLSAYTATATGRVQADIRSQLGLEHAPLFQGSFNRANLYYEVRPKRNQFDQVTAYLRSHPGTSGIIYCLSRKNTEELAADLRALGFKAEAYHAGLTPEQRRTRQERFVRDEIPIIVATIAFGMGIDKPDVRFVIHYDLPKTLEGYYQESGRAGRDSQPSDCILFYSGGDVMQQRRWAEQKETQQERDVALAQLRAMANWAEAVTCRRRELLAYFDESFDRQEGPCCNICSDPPAEEDVTVPAQMFLSCVKRTGERFGSAHIIDVLRGSSSEKVLRFRHEQLSTYGIGKDRTLDEWRDLARELVRRGYLRQDEAAFNALRLQPLAAELLFQGRRLSIPKRRSRKERKTVDPGAQNPALFALLRELRRQIAEEQGIPPYMVFGDQTLLQMAAIQPRDRDQLLRISGVGQHKAGAYGDAFLGAIKTFALDEREAQLKVGLPPTARLTLSLHRDGLSIDEIAARRGLVPSTIVNHLADCITAGEEVQMERLVDPVHRARIERAIGEIGDATLGALREVLGDAFTYDEIRFVRADLRRRA